MSKLQAILPAALAVIAVGAITAPKSMAQDVVCHQEDSGSFALSQQALPEPASRADVAGAVRSARSDGDLDMLYGEDSGSFRLSAMPQPAADAPALFAGRIAD